MNDKETLNWGTYRRDDETLDLCWAWHDQLKKELPDGVIDLAEHFLRGVEAKAPIRSKQVAALAVMQANLLAMQMDPNWKLLC